MLIRGAGRSNRDCNSLPLLPQLYQDSATQSLHYDYAAVFSYFLITESQYPSKIQIGRNLRRSLVQPPAPSSVRDQTRLVRAVSSLFLKPSKDTELHKLPEHPELSADFPR